MSGSWSSTFSRSGGKQLRLVDCPRCGIPIVKIRSKQPESYGPVFFKCPNNIKEDTTTCRFFRSEQQYEAYLCGLDERLKQPVCSPEAHSEGDCIRQLKHQVGEMKQQLDRALGEIWNLKMQMCELKQQQMCEKKSWDHQL